MVAPTTWVRKCGAVIFVVIAAFAFTTCLAMRYELGGNVFSGKLEVTSSNAQSLGDLCDPTVNQEAGYYRVTGTRDLNMFYWFFESRSDPANDPVILWMTGGPGCSDATALFLENGPCLLDGGRAFPRRNEFSWTSAASVIYIDQPCGVGYSYSNGSKSDEDHNEKGVAKHVGSFLLDFFEAHPELRDRPFYIFGESYGGHYVPAVAAAVMDELNLVGAGIGNGLTVPSVQFKYYPELAYTYAKKRIGHPIISYPTYLLQKAGWPLCKQNIDKCQNDTSACVQAQEVCQAMMFMPFQASGTNPYDIRLKCDKEHPLCYDFSNVETFMNNATVKEILGVPSHVEWQDCNNTVNAMFAADWMKNFDKQVVRLLENDVKVMIYAGDMDWICNWIGNKAWTLDLDWSGKDGFNAASDVEVTPHQGKDSVAQVRQFENFTFLRMYDAGHLAPMDQPRVSLAMVKWFTGTLPSLPSKASSEIAAF